MMHRSYGSWHGKKCCSLGRICLGDGRRSCIDVSGRGREKTPKYAVKNVRLRSKPKLRSRLMTQEEGVGFDAAQ